MTVSVPDPVFKMSSIRSMADTKARPERFDVTLPNGTKAKVGRAQAARYGVRVADAPADPPPETPAPPAPELFDPTTATVDQVLEHLTKPDTDDAERERVLELERQGHKRKGILGNE